MKEAQALIELAKKGSVSSQREQFIAALGWELARYAFHHDLLPKACLEVMSGERASLSMCACPWDEVFSHAHFPKSKWAELPKDEKIFLIRHLVGEQSSGARFLKGAEARRHAEWFRLQKTTPDFRPMDDGGFVVMLRVYPDSGHNTISRGIMSELQRTDLPKYGRSNANDVQRYVERLKGLAGLWLEAGSIPERQQNTLIFPSRARMKADYGALKKSKVAAETSLAEMLEALKGSSSEAEMLETMALPLLADLTAATKGKKRGKKRS
jgi:hypothetical protein